MRIVSSAVRPAPIDIDQDSAEMGERLARLLPELLPN